MVTRMKSLGEGRTIHWRVDPDFPDRRTITAAAALIREGGLVAFPTETVYGLGANALDRQAVKRVFAVKGRPDDNPLIVHVGERAEISGLVRDLPPSAEKLIGLFWPGPLTLVLPRSDRVSPAVTAGLDKVAVRMPAHPVALALIREAGVPVAAPSANTSGRPSPTTAAHVLEDLDGRIEAVLDGGPVPVGVESTVLDLTVSPPVILRPGGVTGRQLAAVLGAVVHHPEAAPGRPQAPGMKYRHYAPRTPLVLVEGPPAAVTARIRELAAAARASGERVAVLARTDTAAYYPDGPVVPCGKSNDPGSAAAALYSALRECDALGADLILAEGLAAEGLGRAVMNRLRKAAAKIVVVEAGS
ncbi:Sua5/YciO/YrdC/YwlC family protein [Candidatus Desulforudis audaxviator MP104C]|uniref:Threonylcarbamoyl-AMP synthase n=2 Tax=Candidatus Desulforudis TaxID=471826 RepID=B1I6K9_DESAP|nr:Sua5/YciO/YrdC/YwlC family protein [Candidatus Desulforudis audaxviator MP104C]AZK60721.1 TsaC protein (YrdC-Sua5 domains) required for threonylcarbamoyladenosine t(6)A37 modification in tRNA [Candidatus Desulforudis audaxviator]